MDLAPDEFLSVLIAVKPSFTFTGPVHPSEGGKKKGSCQAGTESRLGQRYIRRSHPDPGEGHQQAKGDKQDNRLEYVFSIEQAPAKPQQGQDQQDVEECEDEIGHDRVHG